MLRTPVGEVTARRVGRDVRAQRARAVLPRAARRAGPARARAASIVNIADLAAFETWPAYVPHGMTKAAVVQMTRALAHALAPDVRVNAVAPGVVLLPEGWSDEEARASAAHHAARAPRHAGGRRAGGHVPARGGVRHRRGDPCRRRTTHPALSAAPRVARDTQRFGTHRRRRRRMLRQLLRAPARPRRTRRSASTWDELVVVDRDSALRGRARSAPTERPPRSTHRRRGVARFFDAYLARGGADRRRDATTPSSRRR